MKGLVLSLATGALLGALVAAVGIRPLTWVVCALALAATVRDRGARR